MKRNKELSVALEGLAAELRRRPEMKVSAEDIFAYLNDELAAEERERVEEAIALDPEAALLASQFAAFPPAATRGEPGHLSPEELAQDWKKIQGRIRSGARQRGPDRRDRRLPALALLAASLLAILGLALWGYQERAGRLGAEQRLAATSGVQINVEFHRLAPLAPRGSSPVEVAPRRLEGSGDVLFLQLATLDPQPYDDYRLEVRSMDRMGEQPLWSRSGLKLLPDATFSVALSRAALAPGRYEIRVVGISSSGTEAQVFADRIEIPPA